MPYTTREPIALKQTTSKSKPAIIQIVTDGIQKQTDRGNTILGHPESRDGSGTSNDHEPRTVVRMKNSQADQ